MTHLSKKKKEACMTHIYGCFYCQEKCWLGHLADKTKVSSVLSIAEVKGY